MNIKTIHPFPARMAPEIVKDSLVDLAPRTRVLDPMCGSGTVLRSAVEAGMQCSGVDIDPLAVLMSKVWVTPIDTTCILGAASNMVEKAQTLASEQVDPFPDDETQAFVSFWFAFDQRYQLRRLATVLKHCDEPERDALSIALSRTIVTKEKVASLARDTSHSRPHRVARDNDFDVYTGFLRAVKHISKRLTPELIRGTANVSRGDARDLHQFSNQSFDIVVTSPPYLNAIDYLRGHKLTLVWLGYKLSQVRTMRSASVGAEKRPDPGMSFSDVSRYVAKGDETKFESKHLNWIERYAVDMNAIVRELARVVKSNGRIVMVVGNSFLRGAHVDNALLVKDVAHSAGLAVETTAVRSIPARRRYLPPPGSGNAMLDTRMRTETILKFRV